MQHISYQWITKPTPSKGGQVGRVRDYLIVNFVFFVQTKRAGALTRVVRVKKGGRPNDLAPPPSHKYKKIENLLFPFYFSNIRPRDVFITGYNVVWHSTAVSRHFATLHGIQPPYRGILKRCAALYRRRRGGFYPHPRCCGVFTSILLRCW